MGVLMTNKPFLVLEDTKDFLVVYKNSNIPSAPGKTPNSCYELVSLEYPEIKLVKGKNQNDGGLVHRLDTETSGLMLFAKNQDFYDLIMAEQIENRFEKKYTAYCAISLDKKVNFENKVLTSYFRSFGEKGASVKPIFNLEEESRANKKKCGNKLYTTKILSVMDFAKSENMKLLKIKCKISNGFRHQVRSHLASQELPVFGDKIYNPTFPAEKMLFFASEISFLQENYKLEDSYLDEIASKIFLASATK